MKPDELEKLLGVGEAKSFDFRGAIYAVRDRLWIPVLVVLLAGAVAAVYVSRAPLIYAARTVLMVEEEGSKVVNIEGVNSEDMRSAELLNTLIQSMQSREVTAGVVKHLKLDQDPEFLQGTGLKTTSPEAAMALLSQALNVSLRKDTRLVDIVVEHRDPEVARKLADAVAQEFLNQRVEADAVSTGNAGAFLLKKSNELKENVQKSEEALHQYKVDNNAFSLEDNQNTIVQQLKEFNDKLTQAKSARLSLEGDVAQARKMDGNPRELILLPSIADNPAVSAIIQQISDKEAEISALSQRYRAKHPKYIAAQAGLATLRAQLDTAVLNAADLLNASFRAAQETEAGLAQAVSDQEKQAAELNKKAIQYNALTREMETNLAMYQAVLSRLKETDVTKQLDETPVHVVEPAFAYGPVRPKKQAILTGAIGGAFIFGVLIAYGLSLLDTSLKTVDECEQFLELPTLTAIPRTKITGAPTEATLPMISDPKGAVAESFRSLRSSLSLLGREENRRSFLFTSAIPSEGKSFTCCNYAIVSAQAGVSTLLVDADLRRPGISNIFFGKSKTPGLSDLLAGQAELNDAIYSTDMVHLSILPAGRTAPNPAELLCTDAFGLLISEALLRYDRIIIDTAPINAVSDTLMLAPHVQTICMILRSGMSPRKAVQRACKALADIKCRPAGTILNYLPEGHGPGYYYYYSPGKYGSKGVYGATEAS